MSAKKGQLKTSLLSLTRLPTSYPQPTETRVINGNPSLFLPFLSLLRPNMAWVFFQLSNTYEYAWITKVALIPYITAGDPDLSTTAKALKVLDSCGADLIEVGVPYSDPLADGPVIQVALESTDINYIANHFKPFRWSGILNLYLYLHRLQLRVPCYMEPTMMLSSPCLEM